MQPEPPDDVPTLMSRTAVLAAMFAVPVCCPPMSLLACITGVVALVQIRRDRALHGGWLAWMAIATGATCGIVMSALLWSHGLGTLLRGPGPAMRALAEADPEGMRTHWSGPAANLPPDRLRAFASELEARFGRLVEADGSATRTTPLKLEPKRSITTIPVTLRFERPAITAGATPERTSVEADLGFELFDERTGATVMRWRSLRINVAAGNEVLFPPDEPPPPTLEPARPRAATSAPPTPALR